MTCREALDRLDQAISLVNGIHLDIDEFDAYIDEAESYLNNALDFVAEIEANGEQYPG
jgi:hypothetical protein